ncbi:MAG: outer membrane protein transport protein [Nitrospira sp.]|nr:outer membrane protein transport protein [Nitrospira sp.]
MKNLFGYLLATLAVIPEIAYADAFRNPFQSASAIGQGLAFAAQADDPSAIHYNPAGMTQLRGVQIAAGVQFVGVNTNYTSPTGVTTKNEKSFPVGLPPPGQFFITANMADLGPKVLNGLTIGLGVENLYGFGAKYPQDGPFNSAVTTAQLPLLDIKPTIAYKISNMISIGLGADIFTFASFLGEGQIEQQFVWPGGLGIPAGSNIEVNGTGTTAGLNASLLVTPLRNDDGKPLLNLGFIWRSQAVLPLSGQLLVNGTAVANASSSIRFPESFSWAIAGWPVRNLEREWKLEVDLDYVRWQSVRNSDIQLSNGITISNPQPWTNSVTFIIGTEYKWLSLGSHSAWDIALRTGYNRSQTPIPNVVFTPALPDSNVNTFSVGAGFMCKPGGHFLGFLSCGDPEGGKKWLKGMGLDLAYAAAVFDTRTVTENRNPTVDGTYQTTNHIGAMTFRLNF